MVQLAHVMRTLAQNLASAAAQAAGGGIKGGDGGGTPSPRFILRLDVNLVWLNCKRIDIPHREFILIEILALSAKSSGKDVPPFLPKERLLEDIEQNFPDEWPAATNTEVDRSVYKIREAFEAAGFPRDLLETGRMKLRLGSPEFPLKIL